MKAALENQSIQDWFRRMPWRPEHSPLQWTPDYENFLLEIWRHENFDEYWKQAGLCAEAHYTEFSDVPQVHMGSWYDPYARATTDNYVALSAMKQGPVSLIMGPWTHGQRSVTHSGDADFGVQSTLDGNLDEDFNRIRLRFFDRHLKGQVGPKDSEYPVKLFIMAAVRASATLSGGWTMGDVGGKRGNGRWRARRKRRFTCSPADACPSRLPPGNTRPRSTCLTPTIRCPPLGATYPLGCP